MRIGCTIFMIVQHNGYVGQYQYNCHANGQYIVYERMICLDYDGQIAIILDIPIIIFKMSILYSDNEKILSGMDQYLLIPFLGE